MNRTLGILLAVAVLLGVAGQVAADTFVNPPEVLWNPPWTAPFPYQRNIYYAGTSLTGTETPVYEGTLDYSLSSSDFVSLSGSVQYYPVVTMSGGTYTHVLGIDNTTGGTLTGTAAYTIDNVPIENPWKLFYLEDTNAISPTGASLVASVSAAGSTTSGGAILYSGTYSSNPALFLVDQGWELNPNPYEETLTYNFAVAPGDFAFLNSVHVATYCEPEPSTVALLGASSVGLLVYARRRRRGGRRT